MNVRTLKDDEARSLADEINEQGFAVIEDAFDEAYQQVLQEEFDRLETLRPGGDIPPAPFSGYQTRRWFDLLNDGDIWQQVAIHPGVMSVMNHVLGEGFLLSTMGTAIIGSGEKIQPFHVDDGVYQFPRPHPNLVCNTMWAVGDFTEANGATRVVPGSNRLAEDPDFSRDYEHVQLTMPAGSIGFVVGTTYHGAGENSTQEDRLGMTINYCNGSMRQQENLMLATHPSRMLTFPQTLQDILGFKVCKGAGHIFAGDPRAEMERHYGPAHPDEAWMAKRGERATGSNR
ncbi:MAG: hypothetical protein CMQ05_17370 [Gammaproteobacteria bacterium]|nr:hypothetical protein [Gammaproteobacteria bacterium]